MEEEVLVMGHDLKLPDGFAIKELSQLHQWTSSFSVAEIPL